MVGTFKNKLVVQKGRSIMSVKQKDAVFAAVVSVKGTSNFSDVVSLSKEERATVCSELFAGIRDGSVVFGDTTIDDTKLNAYISGLVSNWLRKDTRLNGNTKYVAKNPGTRTGSGDDSLKAMRALLTATSDESARAEIQAEIDKRLGELKPKKVINVAALPESLRHLAQ